MVLRAKRWRTGRRDSDNDHGNSDKKGRSQKCGRLNAGVYYFHSDTEGFAALVGSSKSLVNTQMSFITSLYQPPYLMIDGGVPALNSIFNDVCILVTAAFVLTFVPGLRLQERSRLSMRDRGTALCVFLVLGLVEEAGVARTDWLNERIVTVCAAGLVAGPLVGLVVSVFVTWLAVGYDGLPLGSMGYRCCAVAWLEGGYTDGAPDSRNSQ
jgi:hypothetical protein